MKIKDLMTTDVKSCHAEDNAGYAAQLMWEGDFGVVPIVNDDRQVVGMVSDRDIAMAAYLKGLPLAAISVESVMSTHVHTCQPDEPVSAAEERMRQHQVRRLPVADAEGRLLGILSMNDIVLAAAQQKGSRKPELVADEIATTFAEVCKHRHSVQIAAE